MKLNGHFLVCGKSLIARRITILIICIREKGLLAQSSIYMHALPTYIWKLFTFIPPVLLGEIGCFAS